MSIEPGLTHEITFVVQNNHTAAAQGGDNFVPVLSTPFLIGQIEETAHTAIVEYLKPGQSGVGAIVNIKHMAATPIGMQVRIRAELIEVDRRRLVFNVEAWDEIEKIAEGQHERFIIDQERFMEKVKEKQQMA